MAAARKKENGNGTDRATLTDAPLATKRETPVIARGMPGPEPDEHIVYYSPHGGQVFAALHDDTPENHAGVLEAEEQWKREGRAFKKVRVRTDDLPPHKDGGHHIGACKIHPDGTLEVSG